MLFSFNFTFVDPGYRIVSIQMFSLPLIFLFSKRQILETNNNKL
jgi:hypothetical protein